MDKSGDEKKLGHRRKPNGFFWEQGPRQWKKGMRTPRERKQNTTDLVLILSETEKEGMGEGRPEERSERTLNSASPVLRMFRAGQRGLWQLQIPVSPWLPPSCSFLAL